MIRLVLKLTEEEAARLGRLALSSDHAGRRPDVLESLCRKIRVAIAESEAEPDEPQYTHEIGGESGEGS